MARTYRQALAAALAPLVDADVTVYAEPPDVIAIPGVVIMANPDYQRPSTFGGPSRGLIDVSIGIGVMMHRTPVDISYGRVEDLYDQIRQALAVAPDPWQWVTASSIDTDEYNDYPVLRGSIEAVSKQPLAPA